MAENLSRKDKGTNHDTYTRTDLAGEQAKIRYLRISAEKNLSITIIPGVRGFCFWVILIERAGHIHVSLNSASIGKTD